MGALPYCYDAGEDMTAEQRALAAALSEEKSELAVGASSIYAHAVSRGRLEAWVAKHGVKLVDSPYRCPLRLVGRRACGYCWRYERSESPNCWHLHEAGVLDHTSLWVRDGRPVVFVTQPYGLDGDGARALDDFCVDHGLRWRVDTWPAWHFPGEVLHIELWRADERQ